MLRPILLSLLIFATVPAVSADAEPVSVAADNLACRATTAVFVVNANLALDYNEHSEPETGANVWTGWRAGVGGGWEGRVLAGPDGRMYMVFPNGDVVRHRWHGNGWDNNGNGTKLNTDWTDWNLPENRFRNTVDEKGDFYAIRDAGALYWYRYDETAKTWTSRIIDTGWGQKYDMIFAAGEGVIYARTPAGSLYRYQYHVPSQRWIDYENLVGNGGWQRYRDITSPGGDIIYAVDRDSRQMHWYRYLGNNTWAEGPKVMSTGWTPEWRNAVTTDHCKLTTNQFPPSVTSPLKETAPSTVIEGTNGLLQYFYIDTFGRLIHGRQRNPNDIRIVDFTPVPGYQSFADTPAAVRDGNGNLQTISLGQDGESRRTTQLPGQMVWKPFTDVGGWTSGRPQTISDTDNTITALLVDNGGNLLTSNQEPATGRTQGWRPTGVNNLTPTITTTRASTGHDVLVKTTTGELKASRYTNGTFSPWRNLITYSGESPVAAVLNPNNTLQLFARQPDGTITTHRETTNGATPTWLPLPVITASGAPVATVSGTGLIHVAVRATDGYIYVTEQVAPASNTYRPWTRLTDQRTGLSYASATDPAAVSTSTGLAVLTYRDHDGRSYVFQSIVPAPARGQQDQPTEYHGGPIGKPTL